MSQNDEAWQRYLSAKSYDLSGAVFEVDAEELRQLSGREARLLAKFDTPEQLAEPLRSRGYTLLPVRNGAYRLLPGSLFQPVPTCEPVEAFAPTLPFPLLTAGRGQGESQYIDHAFNSGLLSHFAGGGEMFQTIRGREYSVPFRFSFGGQSLDVQSVQIEVDSGYESLYDVILVEAKIGAARHFNIRQLYYPFRHFGVLVPTKHIRTIFLTYDIPSSVYQLFEYAFDAPTELKSIRLARCASYRVAPPHPLTVHDLLDSSYRTTNRLVPQANDINKVFELLTLVEAGIVSASDVADYFAFDMRQSSYYREAAEYLGLLHVNADRSYALTPLGLRILSTPVEQQARAFAKSIANSWIVAALIQLGMQQGRFTLSMIDEVIGSALTEDGQQRYSRSTVPRRRQTIVAWLRWLAAEFGVFRIDGDAFVLT